MAGTEVERRGTGEGKETEGEKETRKRDVHPVRKGGQSQEPH